MRRNPARARGPSCTRERVDAAIDVFRAERGFIVLVEGRFNFGRWVVAVPVYSSDREKKLSYACNVPLDADGSVLTLPCVASPP